VPSKKFVEWDVPDPEDGPMSLYEALFDNLMRRIRELIRDIEGSPL
jgi:protein-tyrosine-phosphatase